VCNTQTQKSHLNKAWWRLRWPLVRKVAIGQSVLLASFSAGCKIASGAAHRFSTAAPAEPPPRPPQPAPTRVRRSLFHHLTEMHAWPAMLRNGRDRTVPQRPLRYVSQSLWVLFLLVICHPSAGYAIVITAQSCFGWCEANPLDCYLLVLKMAANLTVSISVAIL